MRSRLALSILLICLGCSSGEKKEPEPVCTPGASQCASDGASIEICAEDGMSWQTTETCLAGASCIDGACQCPTRQVLGADGCLTPGILECAEGFEQGELQCAIEQAGCGAGEVQVVGGCAAVGVAECPDTGWVADDETGGCKVPSGDCADHEDWVIGEGCVAIGPDKECGNVETPFGPEEVTGETLYVWADSPQPNGTGTIDQPFTSLQQALDAASDGTTIRIGTGTYSGGWVIDKSVNLVGKCPEYVTLDGGVEVQPPDSEVAGHYVLYVKPGHSVDFSGFTLADSGNEAMQRASGIFLEEATNSTLHNLHFDGLSGAAIDLHNCSNVAVDHVSVLEQTLVEGISPYAQSGFGVYILSGTNNTVAYSRFEKTMGVDIKSVNTCPGVTRNHFELRGGIGGLPPMGIWVDICPADTTVIEGNTFHRKMTHAILFEGGSVAIKRNTISGTVTDYDDLNGPAVKLVDADFQVTDNFFFENQYAAINAVDGKGYIEGNRVDSGLPSDPGLKNGDGIILKDCDPGPVILRNNTLVNNTRNGMLVTSSIVAIEDNLVADTQLSPSANSLYGSGLNIVDGSDATIKGNAITGNHRIGIRFDNAYGTIEGNVIADTIKDADGRCGGGIVIGGVKSSYLQSGINRNLLTNNYCAGLYVDNSNVGTIEGNVFLSNKGQSGTLGSGAIIWGSDADVAENWFVDNDDTGLIYHASQGAIHDNLFEGNGVDGLGGGLVVQECPNPKVEVHHNTFVGNGLAGAIVRTSQIEFRRNALVANAPNADGIGGAGAWFEEGTDGDVRANYLSENLLAGLLAYDVADLTLSVNYITNTLVGALPAEESPVQLAEGIVAAQQSFVSLLYNAAVANKYSGLACFNSEGIVKGNTLLSNGNWGLELANSQMTIDTNLFRNNVQGEESAISDRVGPPSALGEYSPCQRN